MKQSDIIPSRENLQNLVSDGWNSWVPEFGKQAGRATRPTARLSQDDITPINSIERDIQRSEFQENHNYERYA